MSDETPAQSGSGAQDQLQAKSSWLWHSHEAGSTGEHLPPGFNTPRPILHRPKTVHIPLVQWKNPVKFSLSHEWLMAAGEESMELELQNQRQMGVFEAIYPRISSIPPNPMSSEPSDFPGEEPPPPMIPVTAIEDDPAEEEAAVDLRSDLATMSSERVPNGGEKPELSFPPGVEPDVAAAASAAFTALLRSNEAGSLIDPDLLIKILSNPSLIEKLLSERGPQETRPVQPMPNTGRLVGLATAPIGGIQLAGDSGYFKTLIQQHGVEESKEIGPGYGPLDWRQNFAHKGVEHGNSKPKIPKLCAFFNSPRGCRNGASCMYIHEASLPQRNDRPSSKKIKLDTEIARRV
ncbi:zinc finger CCCH domain-containing protein 6-like isoform X2 [Wolffia australiana]